MKRTFTTFSLALMIALTSAWTEAPPITVQASTDMPSVRGFLNADGTLNLNSDYSGSLDIGNYRVTLDPVYGPLFSPPGDPTPNAWNALGTTPLMNGVVYTIATSGTDVYVGGSFPDAGADDIAKWDGSAWSALGTTPLNGSLVVAIAVSGTDVYAGGSITDAGGDANADYIAKWNGSAWSALGTTPLNSGVYAIAISGTHAYAGGSFTDAGGDANADKIAKWNGSTWSALGTTPLNSDVEAIAVSGTDVYAGGYFTDAGGDVNADRIAKWNGSVWSALGTTPLNSGVRSIAISGTDVYAGGSFTDAGGDANADYIAKWDGSAWSALGTTPLNNSVYAIAISGTDVYVGGSFTDAGGDANADRIAKWDGSAWSALGTTPLNNSVYAIAISGTDVYAGGSFTDAGGDANADRIAMFFADPTPTVSSITRASANPTGATNVDFTVTFSKSVTNVGIDDFDLDTTGVTSPSISGVSGSGDTYVVTVHTGTGSGTIQLDLIDDDSIVDSGSTPIGGTGAGNGSFTSGETYTITKTYVSLPAPKVAPSFSRFITNDPTPEFFWSSVNRAFEYEVIIASDKAFTSIISNETDSALSFTPSTPLSDGIYYWKVRALSELSQEGKFSPVQTLTIDATAPSAPVLTSPMDGAEIRKSPILRWTKISEGVLYEIQLDDNTDFSSPTTYTARTVLRSLPALPDGVYYWRVRAKDSAGNWSAWSTYREFEIER